MAFDIGQKVTSSWTGPGIVTGELVKEQDTDERTGKPIVLAYQKIKFDSAMLGERLWEIKKLTPVDDGGSAEVV